MGLNFSPTQIAFNAEGDGKFNTPFPEQLEFFRKKLNLPSAHYDDIIHAAHDRALIIAGAAKADLLADFRTAIDKSIAEGKSIQWFRRNFDAIVQRHGWAGWTGSDSAAGRDWRARIIYQTNLSSSYSAGRYQQLTDPDTLKLLPYWKYIHSDTVAHPRPIHESWNGTVLPANHQWFLTHFCPNGWGCRCRITAVPASAYQGHPAPDDGFYTFTDRFGNTHEIPNGVDYGWGYTPGAGQHTPLKDMIDQKLIRFPAPIGADMYQALKPTLQKEAAQQWSNTLDLWMSSNQAGRTAVVGAIDPAILTWLNAHKQIAPITAEIAVKEGLIRGTKQARHNAAGDGLSIDEWKLLPDAVNNPDQVLYDTRTDKLIYVYPSLDQRNMKLAVEFDFNKIKGGPFNLIVSGFKQPNATIKQMIKGGLYEVIQ